MKDHKYGIFVRVKNEKNIIEWIAYHYNLGFTYFIIYDDNSDYPVKKFLQDKNIKKNIYEVHTFDKVKKLIDYDTFFSKIIPILKNKLEFCLYLDIDEYFTMKPKYKSIDHFIVEYGNFNSYSQIHFSWLLFGNSNKKFNYTNSCISAFNKCQNILNLVVKSMVRTDDILDSLSDNPSHYFITKKPSINILGKVAKKPYERHNLSFNMVNGYISHYCMQSTNDYFMRKIIKGDNRTKIKPHFKKILNNNQKSVLNYLHLPDYLNLNNNFINKMKQTRPKLFSILKRHKQIIKNKNKNDTTNNYLMNKWKNTKQRSIKKIKKNNNRNRNRNNGKN